MVWTETRTSFQMWAKGLSQVAAAMPAAAALLLFESFVCFIQPPVVFCRLCHAPLLSSCLLPLSSCLAHCTVLHCTAPQGEYTVNSEGSKTMMDSLMYRTSYYDFGKV